MNSPNWYMGLTQFLSKTQQDFFVDIETIILKFIWIEKWTQIPKPILKKNKVGGINLPHYIDMLYSGSNHDCVW